MSQIRMPGYNEDGSINEKEAAAIQHIFAKFIEYSDKPPQILIDRVMDEQRNAGNTDVTAEEAADMVDGDMIRELLAKEANEICEYTGDEENAGEAQQVISYEREPERIIQMAAQVGLVVRNGRVVKVESICERMTGKLKEIE